MLAAIRCNEVLHALKRPGALTLMCTALVSRLSACHTFFPGISQTHLQASNTCTHPCGPPAATFCPLTVLLFVLYRQRRLIPASLVCVPQHPFSGFGVMARFSLTICLSRILRVASFMSTVLPSPRPGCYRWVLSCGK